VDTPHDPIALIPRNRTITIFLVLIAAGLACNYFGFEIFFNIQFIFGSIFAMLVLQLFGLRWGVLAAAIISSVTYLLWNHPYAIVIMTAEVAVVGVLRERRGIGIVLTDALYWVFIGIPLVILFYYGVMHLPIYTVSITMMKQALNGIANALVARLIFIGVTYQRKKAVFSLRELIFSLLALFVMTPSLLLISFQSRADLERTEQQARKALDLAGQRTIPSVEAWLQSHLNSIQYLAWLSATQPVPTVQRAVDHIRGANPDFLRMGLLDRSATIIAYSPLIDELGQKNIGKNFADRPFIPRLKQTLKPMLSEVVMGRIGIPKPMVTAIAPVVKQGAYAGYVTGILDLDKVRQMIALNMKGASLPDVQFVLLDRNGNVIVSSRQELKPLEPYTRAGGEMTDSRDGISQWIPYNVKFVSASDHWKNALYVTERSIGGLAEWHLILEQPMAPFQKQLSERYAALLSWVFFILLAAVAMAEMASRRFVRSLEKVNGVSTDIPAKISSGTDIVWPKSAIQETDVLIGNIKQMSGTLLHQFGEIQRMKTDLEIRVAERTKELQESEERFRSLFEKVHVVALVIDPADGSIVDANTAASRFYGWSQEHLRTMKISDINVLSGEEIQNEMSAARNEERHYFVFQHRMADGSVREVEAYSGPIQTGGKTLLYSIIHDITERRHAEQQVGEAMHYIETLLRTSPIGIATYKASTGETVTVNEAAARIVGTTIDNIIKQNFRSLESWRRFGLFDLAERALTTGVEQRGDLHMMTTYGNRVDLDCLFVPFMFNSEQHLMLAAMDISARKRTEEALREAKELFALFMHHSPIYTFIKQVTAAESRVLQASDNFDQMIGIPGSAMTGKTMAELFPPEFAAKITADDWAVVSRGEMMQLDEELNGRSYTTIKFPLIQGDRALLAGYTIDITERKLAEEKVKQLANEQQIILDTIAIGVAYVKDRTLIWTNPAFRRIFGYTLQEAENLPARKLYAQEDDYERIGREGYALIAAGGVYATEAIAMKSDGTTFWMSLTGRAVNPSDPAEGSIWMLQNIAERKRSESLLQESERLFRESIEFMPIPIGIANANGSILSYNKSFTQTFGYTVQDISDIDAWIRTAYPDAAYREQTQIIWNKDIASAIATGESTPTREYEVTCRSGQVKHVEIAMRPIGTMFIASFYDITERRHSENALQDKTRQLEDLTRNLEQRVLEEVALRKKNEDILVQQSKLAAMGEMLGAIAHQWRQPLNALGLIVQNLKDAHAYGELDREYIEQAVQKAMSQIRHMSKTIDDFRNFFMPDKERAVFDVMQAVGDVLSLLSAQLAANDIEYVLTCHTHGKTFKNQEDIVSCQEKSLSGFKNEFEHVILNLINNAKDAILDRREKDPEARAQRGSLSFDFYQGDGRVIIKVSDNGGGIPRDALNRIFEPYFTTKDPAKGTGLGLYMSKIIIEDHMQGALSAENHGQGAMFTIELPLPRKGA